MSDPTWLSDHILGEGDPAQREEAERRIAADPALRERAAELRALSAQLEKLPEAAWVSVRESALRDPLEVPPSTPASSTPPPSARTKRRRPRLSRAAVGAVAAMLLFAAGLGTGAALWSTRRGEATRATLVLRSLVAGLHAHGTVRLTATGQLELDVSGLPSTSTGHFYEAWLMSTSSRLVAMASFRVSSTGRARIEISPPAPISSYRYIDVSLQDAAAGPAHSDDSVLRGATQRLAG